MLHYGLHLNVLQLHCLGKRYYKGFHLQLQEPDSQGIYAMYYQVDPLHYRLQLRLNSMSIHNRHHEGLYYVKFRLLFQVHFQTIRLLMHFRPYPMKMGLSHMTNT